MSPQPACEFWSYQPLCHLNQREESWDEDEECRQASDQNNTQSIKAEQPKTSSADYADYTEKISSEEFPK